jgi:phosphohistidine phosphatase
MRLYLVQHGEAKSEEEDPERPLTARGARDVRWVANLAVEIRAVGAVRVLHSGKTRARQTAEIWGGALGVPVIEETGLAPLDDPSIWAARLATEQQDLMLVGHLPHLASLAGLLLASDPERPLVTFRQGALVCFERDQARWSIWLLLPPLA